MFSYKTQQSVSPYRLFMGVGGNRYLMHGQQTRGHNNGVPIKSLTDAKKIAAAWRESGIPAPFLYPEWPSGLK